MNIFDTLYKLEFQSKAIGFYWPNHESAIKQIQDEIREVLEVLQTTPHDQTHLQEELGDLLHAVCSLVFFCNFDTQKTLEMALNKYSNRFYTMQSIAQEHGIEKFENLSLDQMMHYWRMAKHITQADASK
jgi:uncharacterized protein YabN with tetrapyrrole methylase and pyrophosphatase domain